MFTIVKTFHLEMFVQKCFNSPICTANVLINNALRK